MAKEEPAKKKRRIRPSSSETVRERAEKASQAGAKPKREKNAKAPRKVFAPLRAVARPLKWLGRHIIPRYLRDSFKELHNITWPTRKQSRQLTGAVILFAIFFGFFISIMDYGLDKVFKKVFLHE